MVDRRGRRHGRHLAGDLRSAPAGERGHAPRPIPARREDRGGGDGHANHLEILGAHLYDPAPKPSEAVADIPQELEEIVVACLQKKAADRPQTARGLFEMIRAVKTPIWTREDARAWWANANPTQLQRRSLSATVSETLPVALEGRLSLWSSEPSQR